MRDPLETRAQLTGSRLPAASSTMGPVAEQQPRAGGYPAMITR
jgi:hypothetical protein